MRLRLKLNAGKITEGNAVRVKKNLVSVVVSVMPPLRSGCAPSKLK